MKTLVVAACNNENISWLNNINGWKKEIYTKFHPLGREAFVYLDWIINNYFNLPEEVVLAQGDALEHDEKFIDNLSNENKNYCGYITECNMDGAPHHELPIGSWCDVLNLPKKERLEFVSGAQLKLKPEQIQTRTLNYYKIMLEMINLRPEPEVAYIYERLWPAIFQLELRRNNG